MLLEAVMAQAKYEIQSDTKAHLRFHPAEIILLHASFSHWS